MKGISPEVRKKFIATQIKLFGSCYLNDSSADNSGSPDSAGTQPDSDGDEGNDDNGE